MATPSENPTPLTWQDLQAHALWWVRLLYRSVRFCTQVLSKHWRMSLPCMAAGILLMLGLLHLNARAYEMSTTLVYGDLHPKIFGDMAAKLNALLKDGRTNKVSELMQLSQDQVRKIKKVAISDSKGKALSTNYTFRKEPMIFTITLSDILPEDSLRRAITGYFNSNPFTADRLEMKKRQLQEEAAYIEEKLQAVDTILAQLYPSDKLSPAPRSTVTIESSEGKNAYELLAFSRELQQRKAELERSLANPENVIAIDNFILLPKARWDGEHIIRYSLLGAFLGYLLAALAVFWRNNLQKYVQE